jgi:Ca2+-binding EF-hand superfamily protein
MIMTFTARRRAMIATMEQDSIAEFTVYNQMQGQDIERLVSMCMEQFNYKAGGRGSQKAAEAVVKQSQFRQVLLDVSNELGGAISPIEMNRLLHVMPHNSFGKLIYTDFPEAFEKIRFSALKQRYFENQGGLLTAFLSDCTLLEESQHELQRPRHAKQNDPMSSRHMSFVPTGFLDFADLRKMLLSSSTVSLGKLQVMVIVSCFDLAPDGKVDYVKYAPLAVNIIRMLNNPAALRQKAELIESQDLSIASLIADMESETFDQKLKTLFHTYDTNNNGSIDRREFLVCLQSLGFGKTTSELKQIAELAKEYDGFEQNTNTISFDGFKRFFRLHLLNLSKKTEIREMRTRLKSVVSTMTLVEKHKFNEGHFDIGDCVIDGKEEMLLTEHLASLFRIMDKDENPRPGFISHDEVEEVRAGLLASCERAWLSACLTA